MPSIYRYFIAAGLIVCEISAFSWVGQATTTKRPTTELLSGVRSSNIDDWRDSIPSSSTTTIDDWKDSIPSRSTTTISSARSRRQVLEETITSATTTIGSGLAAALVPLEASAAAAEPEQRCDATDPRCGADGILRDNKPRGKPIPRVTNRITHVVQLVIDIGERREEVGFLRFGLYGDDCPKTVRTTLEFLTARGVTGEEDATQLENSIGIQTATVSILEGGIVPEICPGKGVEFGVPSQKKAYARSRGLREAGSNFVPQNRPAGVSLESEPSARKHDVAGLVSVPERGIGYATEGGDVDGAYASSFLITADANSDLLDAKLHRRVIGQVVDDESMEFLARLSSLPIQKKGTKGPPLLRVSVLDAGVQKVGAASSNNQKGNKKKK